MAFSGKLGAELDLAALPTVGEIPVAAKLFGESASRLLVEVAPDNYDAFMRLVADLPVGQIGRVTDTGRLLVRDAAVALIDVDVCEAKAAWQGTFKW